MKYLIVGDIHIHDHKRYDERSRFETNLRVWNRIYKIGMKNGCEAVLFVGDYLENPAVIKAEFLTALLHNEAATNKSRLVYITGNHDQYRPAEPHEVYSIVPEILRYSECIDFKTTSDRTVAGIPYHRDKGMFKDAYLELTKDLRSGAIVLLHQTVKEAIDPTIMPFDFSITEAWIRKDLIHFCGHIHNAVQLAPYWVQTGCPIQHNAGEVDAEVGIWTIEYDLDFNYQIEFHDTSEMFPQFTKEPTEKQGFARDFVINSQAKNVSLGETEMDAGVAEIADSYKANDRVQIVENYYKVAGMGDDLTLEYGKQFL